MEYTNLWTTEHGSAMWGMFKPGISDHDHGTCRIMKTRDILSGHRPVETWKQTKMFIDQVEYDQSYIEIGHLVNLLIKGNVNYLWHVMSPIVIAERFPDYGLLASLQRIVANSPTRRYYHAIKGMAISQKLDETKRPRLAGGKGYRTAARTALFGVDLLSRWEFNFTPSEAIVNLDITADDLEKCLAALDDAYENSPYPDTVDETPFREFLYRVRMMELEGLLWRLE